MAGRDCGGKLLGRQVPVSDTYAPELLDPIPRAAGRQFIGCSERQPFAGADLWHAYELSWLDSSGKPVTWVGRFLIPASSPFMVESKSFKLYLNSLNNTRFAGDAAAIETIRRDIGCVVGADIGIELLDVADTRLAGSTLQGQCLDGLDVGMPDKEPLAQMLVRRSSGDIEEKCYTHLLRSLCPVTGQPDWGTVWIHYRGAALDHRSLLRYIIAYRQHQEFHEQCVERMFCDIHGRLAPEFLHVQAFYTRRGGLDISPFRSTDPCAVPLPRLNRQ